MLRFAAGLGTLVLVGCATPAADRATSTTNAGWANAQMEAQAFVDAVYRFCVPSVERGVPYEALELAETGVFRPVPEGERTVLGDGREGFYWTEAGVVQVDNSSAGYCRVAAYGLPVNQMFDVVAMTITQPSHGFDESDQIPQPPRMAMRAFEKSLGGDLITVVLTGNEPGAAGTLSRFSTLSASVSRGPLEKEKDSDTKG